MRRNAFKTLFVITDDAADVPSVLDALVADGTISYWDDSSPIMLRNSVTGEVVSSCPLSELSLVTDEEEVEKARHFWNGAIEQDGSISLALLRVMRIDDAKRASYIRRYKTCDRYIEEIASVHADAVILPDGSFLSNDGLRGSNQLHDWNIGFVDRFIRPLTRGEMDEAGSRLADGYLVVRAMTYKIA